MVDVAKDEKDGGHVQAVTLLAVAKVLAVAQLENHLVQLDAGTSRTKSFETERLLYSCIQTKQLYIYMSLTKCRTNIFALATLLFCKK